MPWFKQHLAYTPNGGMKGNDMSWYCTDCCGYHETTACPTKYFGQPQSSMADLPTIATSCYADADLSDDALLHAGSAVWDDWRNHVPITVRALWRTLDQSGRAAVFLTAKAVTMYKMSQHQCGHPHPE